MTNKQRLWLAEHPDYEIIPPHLMPGSMTPTVSSDNHLNAGALREDGTFHREKAEPPSILVGIRKGMPR